MALLGKVFDQEVTATNFEPLPAGWYQVKVSKAEVKESKSGAGHYLNIKYDVIGPTHEGRVIFGMITVNNTNPKAEEIGQNQLNSLRQAIGVKRLTDSDQLVGGVCLVKLGIKTDDYGDKNEIKAWKAIEGGSMPTPAKKEEAVTSFADAEKKAPWEK